jgi:pSer/pThr/pTyr-binding forkhead associated (FHA) protein
MTKISKPHLLAVKSPVKIAELQTKEIERRLSLYQVFIKLYEHHSGLLEDILRLENLSLSSVTGLKSNYVQGVVNDSKIYVVTNLGENQTQTLLQSQQIWTIGRDRQNGIYIADKYLSRRHAAIQYIAHESELGFYLVDFKSTNGSFVNGERVYQKMKLKDGDRVRLGNMDFNFFYSHACRTLPTVAMELLMQLASRKECSVDQTLVNVNMEHYSPKTTESAVAFAKNNDWENQHGSDGFSAEKKSEILDRFFSNITPYTNS